MASSLSNSPVQKTIDLHEKKDPIRNLWRNVLIVAVEDLLKKKEIQIKFNNKKYSLEEMWFHHEDFDLICEWAQFEPKIIRKRIYEAIQKMEKRYAENNMSSMPGKWFYKSDEIRRRPNGASTTMYSMRQ